MRIAFEIPEEVAGRLKYVGIEASREARELLLLELFRRRLIAHGQLGDALGLGFHETDALLRARGMPLGPATAEEQERRNHPLGELLERWAGEGEDAQAEQLEAMAHLKTVLPDDFS